MDDIQTPFDVAVVIPTVLRPALARAVRSVFAQEFDGRIQVLIGVDRALGPRRVLDELHRECPERVALTVVDPGYSTALASGGLYPVWSGGALRSALTFLANGKLVAYLDDDNWWAPDHLSSLRAAIDGFDWAYSLRWYVDPRTNEPMGIDTRESVGPGRGIYAGTTGGFVDTNCLMLHKGRCHWAISAWCVPSNAKGAGPDRQILRHLCERHPAAWTGRATAFYTVRPDDVGRARRLIDGGAP